VPIGHVPRQIEIIAKGHCTRTCSPGDIVQVTGVYMPSSYTGWQALKSGLMQKTYIDAFNISKDKVNFREFMLSDEMMEKVNDIKRSMSEEELFLKMSRSICPEIFGMEEVK